MNAIETAPATDSSSDKPKPTSSINATTHGLCAEHFGPSDNAEEFAALVASLIAEYNPVGELEIYLVNRIALCMVRLNRATFLEGQFVQMVHREDMTKPPYPFTIDRLNTTYQRYETAIENKFYRAIKQLQTLQKIRRDADRAEQAPESNSTARRCSKRTRESSPQRPLSKSQLPASEHVASDARANYETNSEHFDGRAPATAELPSPINSEAGELDPFLQAQLEDPPTPPPWVTRMPDPVNGIVRVPIYPSNY
jgi:hypothetical protein